jgi:protein-arginine kinase activator protein McsA
MLFQRVSATGEPIAAFRGFGQVIRAANCLSSFSEIIRGLNLSDCACYSTFLQVLTRFIRVAGFLRIQALLPF